MVKSLHEIFRRTIFSKSLKTSSLEPLQIIDLLAVKKEVAYLEKKVVEVLTDLLHYFTLLKSFL